MECNLTCVLPVAQEDRLLDDGDTLEGHSSGATGLPHGCEGVREVAVVLACQQRKLLLLPLQKKRHVVQNAVS